jgi:Tol biopolymer transport system component
MRMTFRTKKAYQALLLGGCLLTVAAASPAQTASPNSANEASTDAPKEPHLPLVPARKLEYTATEGTWLSLDISPDRKTIIFDLVGHLYELPASGGEARAINSGLSFDSAPRFSPDGKKLAYISDRSGSDHLWVSNADGSDARPLTGEENTAFVSPSWTPDSAFVFVSQKKPAYYDAAFGLWMYDQKVVPACASPRAKRARTRLRIPGRTRSAQSRLPMGAISTIPTSRAISPTT